LRSRRIGAALVTLVILSSACSGDDPKAPDAVPPPTVSVGPPTCPLSGAPLRPDSAGSPAVAVKIENNSAAYPLSGLDKAEIVYEEEVEGGLTRFMAIFHCTDTKKAGPIRSARIVDPAIMTPITRILGDAGGNDIVQKALDKAKIVSIDENAAGDAMRRIYRSGYSSEHTLYANIGKLRKVGSKKYDTPPPDDLFVFGDLEGTAPAAREVTMNFSGATTIGYEWSGGKWHRTDDGEPLVMESGVPIAVDNVIIEQHEINYSKTIRDVAGNPSVEIADVTGSGKAILFRDGKMIKGRWVRKTVKAGVVYETASGERMVLHPGTTWIELLPDGKGEVKGSYSTVPTGGKGGKPKKD
jgi:DUF3048 family protein